MLPVTVKALEKVRLEVPVFVIVAYCTALAVLIAWLAKVSEAGKMLTATPSVAVAIVTDCELNFVVSSTLVAVTVTFSAVDGAVSRPEDEIVPAEALQVTAALYAPVPSTVAENCPVAPSTMAAGPETDTLVIVGVGAAVTVVDCDPDFVGSSTLVAVTVTL